MITVNAELAAQLVATLGMLTESIIPEMEKVATHDPRTVRKLRQAAEVMADALDRIFLDDPRLKYDVKQIVDRGVIVLDIGTIGVLQAFECALKAYDRARPPSGANPSRGRFEKELAALLGIKERAE